MLPKYFWKKTLNLYLINNSKNPLHIMELFFPSTTWKWTHGETSEMFQCLRLYKNPVPLFLLVVLQLKCLKVFKALLFTLDTQILQVHQAALHLLKVGLHLSWGTELNLNPRSLHCLLTIFAQIRWSYTWYWDGDDVSEIWDLIGAGHLDGVWCRKS